MYTMLGYDFHIFVHFSGLVTADKIVKLAIQEAKKGKDMYEAEETDMNWEPWTGCSPYSEGCKYCYKTACGNACDDGSDPAEDH